MASSRNYLGFVLEQLSELGDVISRAFLCERAEATYPKLPKPKSRAPKAPC